MTNPTGTPTLTLPDGLPDWQVAAVAKALTRVTVDPEAGCWISGWCISDKGYSVIKCGGKNRGVHRLMCASANGVDLGGLSGEVDTLHSCDNPPCCNPEHLTFGTARDNMRDRDGRGRNGYSKRTHCPRGHRLAGANLIPSGLSAGRRRCLVCGRARSDVSGAAKRGIHVTFEDALADQLRRTDKGRDQVARDALS